MGHFLGAPVRSSVARPTGFVSLGMAFFEMRLIKIIFCAWLWAALAAGTFAAQAAAESAPLPSLTATPEASTPAEAGAEAGGHEGLTSEPNTIFILFGKFPVTNSMLVTWIVALGIIFFAQCAARKLHEVTGGPPVIWGWLGEAL